MDNRQLFKPRDFIYMNTNKLDSYFSQLFGGLIQNVQTSDDEEEQKGKNTTIGVKAAGNIGLGKGSGKLIDFFLSQVGSCNRQVA